MIKNKLQKICTEIADGLLKKFRDNELIFSENDASIYSGDAGVLLFIVEVYQKTNDARYLDYIIDFANSLEHKVDLIDNVGFYTGKSGIAYTFIKVYHATNNERYLRIATSILKECQIEDINNPDLLSGISGMVVSLLHLHVELRDSWIVNKVYAILNGLLSKAHISSYGLYWDGTFLNIKPLSGLSHGSSGIAFVFFECGKYFKDNDLIKVARFIVNHENASFDKVHESWPDFRTGILTDRDFQERKKEYKEGAAKYLSPSQTVAWCNGPIGIGFSRLDFSMNVDDLQMKADLEWCVKSSIEWAQAKRLEERSFSLCHGAGGNGIFLLELFGAIGGSLYLKNCLEIARSAIKQYERDRLFKSGDPKFKNFLDVSLLNGQTGVAYFFIKLLSLEEKKESILYPKIPQKALDFSSKGTISFHNVLRTDYSKTLHYLNLHALDNRLDIHTNNLRAQISKAIIGLNQEQATELFDLESQKIDLRESIKNKALLSIKEALEIEENTDICNSQNKLSDIKFALSPTVILYRFKSETGNGADDKMKGPSHRYVMLWWKNNRVLEQPLNAFTYLILNNFGHGITYLNLIDSICDKFPNNEKKLVSSKIFSQFQEVVRSGIVIKSEHSYADCFQE